MVKAQKARIVQVTLPEMSADAMENAEQNIFNRRYIHYKEGVIRYSVNIHTFQDMARDVGAVIKCKGVSLVDTMIFEEYLDSFRG